MSPGRPLRPGLDQYMSASNKTANAFLGPRRHFQSRAPPSSTQSAPEPVQPLPLPSSTEPLAQTGPSTTAHPAVTDAAQISHPAPYSLGVVPVTEAPLRPSGSGTFLARPAGSPLSVDVPPAVPAVGTSSGFLPDPPQSDVNGPLWHSGSTPLFTSRNTPALASPLRPPPLPVAADPCSAGPASSTSFQPVSSHHKRPRPVPRDPPTYGSRTNIAGSLPSPTPTDEPSPVTTGVQESPESIRTRMDIPTTSTPSGSTTRAPDPAVQFSPSLTTATGHSTQQPRYPGVTEPGHHVGTSSAVQNASSTASNTAGTSEATEDGLRENPLDLLRLSNTLKTQRDRVAGSVGQMDPNGNISKRYQILSDAVEQGDIFLLVLHQIYCLRSLNNPIIPEIILPRVGDQGFASTGMAFQVLDAALSSNANIPPDHVTWFAMFPAQSSHGLGHPALQPYLDEVTRFLVLLGRNWGNACKTIQERGYPFLAREFWHVFGLDSKTLQSILFTVSRKILGVRDGAIALRMMDYFREDCRMAKAVLPDQARTVFQNQLLHAYMHLMGTYKREESIRLQQQSMRNMVPHGQGHGAGSATGLPGSPQLQNSQYAAQRAHYLQGQQPHMQGQQIQMQGQQIQMQGQQDFRANPVYQQQMQPQAHHQQMQRVQQQGQRQGSSVAGQRISNSPQSFGNPQMVSYGSMQAAQASAARQPSQAQRPAAVPGQSVQGHMHLVPPGSAGAGPSTSSNRAFPVNPNTVNPFQNGAPAAPGNPRLMTWNQTHSQSQAMTPGMILQPPNTFAQNPQQQRSQQSFTPPSHAFGAMPARPPSGLQPQQRPPPNQASGQPQQHRGGGGGAVQNGLSPQTPGSNRKPDLFIPSPSQVIRVDRIPPTQYDFRSVEMSLHQLGARSPRRVPRSLPTAPVPTSERFYQAVTGFVAKPVIINSNGHHAEVQFDISPEDFDNKLSKYYKPPGESAVVCNYFDGSLRYRLRACEAPKDRLSPLLGVDWVTMSTFWPEHLFVTANGKAVTIRRKSHNGQALPAELTEFLKSGTNAITISVLPPVKTKPSTSFVAVIELIETYSHSSIRKMVEASGKIAADVTLGIIKRRLEPHEEEEEELFVTDNSLSVDITEPYAKQMFKVPARGVGCTHLECFDLDIFLETRQSKKLCPHRGRPGCKACVRLEALGPEPSLVDQWKCPICDKDARPSSLRIDMFLEEVRDRLVREGRGNTKSILVRADGSWVARVEEEDDDNDEDEEMNEPAPKRRKPEPGAGKPEPVVIEID